MEYNLLRVIDLEVSVKTKKEDDLKIVDRVSFDIKPGEVIALIGESGSGKTTISLGCMGYTRPGCRITGGAVHLGDKSIFDQSLSDLQKLRGSAITYVAQSAAASFNGAMTINSQVTEIPIVTKSMTRAQAIVKAEKLYADLDLPEPNKIGQRYPHQVSGGQLQRLMAAMAMISDPQLLILDEPTTALDVTTQIEVLYSFKRLIRKRNAAAIYVSHDLSLVAQIADNILVLKNGKKIEYGQTEQIISEPQNNYTKELMEAAHVMPKQICTKQSKLSKKAPLLKMTNITAGYGKNQGNLALTKINLEVGVGETVGIIGESGSGKTTLGRVISGLMSPLEGNVFLEGKELAQKVAKRKRYELQQIQFAFQMADVALNPLQKVEKILSRPIQFYRKLSRKDSLIEVARLLERVDLPTDFANRFPLELSGGQRQRINLARALAALPKLIICDEITSALDTIVAQQILELLESLQEELRISYLFISHDISIVSQISERVVVMHHGEVVEEGPTAKILTSPSHDYTMLLLNSVPEMRTDWLDEAITKRRRLLENLN